jgi:[NiFe] hydrogenase diaphorase moiety large subunit
MDVVRAVQARHGAVPAEAMDAIAATLKIHRVEVEAVVSFYAFLSEKPKGRIVIRLCNDVVDRMQGADRVAAAFSEELGIPMGGTTPDGAITLEWAPCIGLTDQAPAALVNEVPVTRLTTDRAKEIVRELKKHGDPRKLVKELGHGNNAHPLVQSMVRNNVRQTGPVIFEAMEAGSALKKALAMSPAEVIRDLKTARLRGRGGAGFPTGMKWEFTRGAEGTKKVVVCNADEGEPGTFKDRVILTECADLMFEGMTIGGYAIGADTGLVYLRGEYEYLSAFLEAELEKKRKAGLLGRNVGGKQGFDFDIRIQLGAGAYVCGEETALLSSAEGLRGDPKNRPPFPAQKGYLGLPTAVNNVETYCCVARILDKGAAWFAQLGSKGSSGTKLLSIAGDCKRPGVYEVPFGITLKAMLDLCGAEDTKAVQVGGPSGTLVGPAEFGRTICYDDLATGGSIMVFGPDRDLVDVAHQFLEFFVEETCGYCTPCRAGNVLLKQAVEKILAGHGVPADLEALQELSETIKTMSRCGLGQTSANPVLTGLKNFRSAWESRCKADGTGFQPTFDIRKALGVAEGLVGRKSVLFEGGAR